MSAYDTKNDIDEEFRKAVEGLDEAGMEQRAYDGAFDDMMDGQSDDSVGSAESGDYDAFREEARRFREQIDSGQGISMNLPGSDERLQLYRDRSKANKKNEKDGMAKSYLKKRAAIALTGSGLSGIGGLIIAIIMSISPLKFEFLFNNVDASAFVRYNVLFDRRSSKFIDAYVKARLFEIDSGDPTRGNMLFRANRVDNNNPFLDWYRTMRTSSFEADLLKKHGISFAAITDVDPSTGALRGIRGAQITFKDQPLDFDFEKALRDAGLNVDSFEDAINNGDFDFINRLPEGQLNQLLDVDIMPDDSTARKAIRTAINQEIPFYRFIRRATLRRNIANMIGVREWRFFETTRGRIDDRKLRFQNKLLEKTFGLTNNNGKFFTCLFGGKCIKTADVSSPEVSHNGAGSVEGGGDQTYDDGNEETTSDTDAEARTSHADERSNAANAAKNSLDELTGELADSVGEGNDVVTNRLQKLLTSKLLSKIGVVTAVFDIIDFMDSMAGVHKNISSGAVQKMLIAARLASYISVYTAFATLKDQINSGEVIGEDAAAAFESLNGIELSEAYQLIVAKKAISQLDKEEGCKPGKEDVRAKALGKSYGKDSESGETISKEDVAVEPICPEDKIGESGSSGERLIDAYNNGIGKIIAPLAEAYNGVTSIPGISQLVDGITWVTGKIGDVTSFLTDQVINALGFGDDKARLMEWIGQQMANFFNLGPVIDGSYAPATMNAIFTGGVGLAESTIRLAGGALPTASSQAHMDNLVAQYQKEQMENTSIWDKYFALDKPNSLTVRIASSIPTDFDSIKEGFTNQPKYIASTLSQPVFAEEALPKPADLVGQQMYDLSVERLESSPLRSSPEECTNARDILGGDFPLSWDSVSDATRFWQAVHSKAGELFDDDEYDAQVGRIENVCLADAIVSNSMKTQYTKDDDGGLSSTAATTAGSNSPTAAPGELQYPPNLGGANSEGYFTMPESTDGSYVFSSGAPARSRCGSQALIGVIYTVAKRWKQEFPGSTIVVGDLNEEQGHVSHNNGTDVDITVQGSPDAANTSQDPTAQYSIRLAQLFADTKLVKVIGYQDQRVISDYASYAAARGLPGNVAPWSGHADHFHVRILDQFKGPYSGQCAP